MSHLKKYPFYRENRFTNDIDKFTRLYTFLPEDLTLTILDELTTDFRFGDESD